MACKIDREAWKWPSPCPYYKGSGHRNYHRKMPTDRWDICCALDDEAIRRVFFSVRYSPAAWKDFCRKPKTEQKLDLVIKAIYGIKHLTRSDAVLDCTFILATIDVDPRDINERLIALNALPTLLRLVHFEDHPDIQHWACWAITRISYGTEEHKRFLVKAGACPVFIKFLLVSRDDSFIWGALELFHELTHGHPQRCAMAIAQGIVPALASIIGRSLPEQAMEHLLECLYNILRFFPQELPYGLASSYLNAIMTILPHINDYWIIVYAYRSIVSIICEGPRKHAELMEDVGFLKHFVEAVQYPYDSNIRVPAMKILSRICNLHPQLAVHHGALSAFVELLSYGRRDDHASLILMTLKYMSACYTKLIAEVARGPLLPCIVNLLQCDDECIQYETAMALLVMTDNSTVDKQILLILLDRTLPPFCEIMHRQSSCFKLVERVMIAVHSMLRAVESTDTRRPVWVLLEKVQILHRLEALQWHDNQCIGRRAATLTSACYRFYCIGRP